ncbi:MAG: hypothetical protein D6711_03840 [Chloroflexi bacterium]|nr:MAG: hypothetical protein D6711_03840 [Chloroflexota bacterium]
MFFDWIAREGWILVNWWLISTIGGLTVMPLLGRLFPALPDKGYTLSRTAGWLLIGFTFWFLGVLGFIDNSVGSILFAWGLVLLLALVAHIVHPVDWRAWWHENRWLVLVTEVLFIVLLVGFALFRAHQNNYTSTEKPMDLAFMSAIQQSQSFPPNDPWLSGYAISYYYFGYLLAAMNAMLAGVPSTIGYNMHLALLFALAGISAFGVTYNLVRSRAFEFGVWLNNGVTRKTAMLFGGLAAFFLLWMSNFHMPIVEMPYRAGIASDDYLCFWDAKEREVYSDGFQPINVWDPDEYPSWFWFGASRTITERALATPGYEGACANSMFRQRGARINEVIDEFPAFSFILGDSHPHVMSLPFVLLVLGMALNVMLSSQPPERWQILFYGVGIGALIFFNTWDAPMYLVVLIGAEAIRRLKWQRLSKIWQDWLELLGLGVAVLIVGLLVSAPFLIGFRSQLGGVLPNVLHPTRTQQLFVMFGPFILLLGGYLILETWRSFKARRINLSVGFGVAGMVFAGLLLMMLFLLAVGVIAPDYRVTLNQYVTQYGGWREVTEQIIGRWLARGLTPLILFVTLGFGMACLFGNKQDDETRAYPLQNSFALLLLVCGLGLIIVPEFVYLRDNFGTRMNTVFKFYYQAWVMFSICAAYGVYTLTMDINLWKPPAMLRGTYGALVVLLMVVGSIYSLFGYYNRMFLYRETADLTLTLDGGRNFIPSNADYDAIMCLKDVVGRDEAVVAEANPEANPSRVNYNPEHGRVGSLTGIPVIIGWTGHQSQWRGTGYGEAVGTRTSDLDMLFRDPRLSITQQIIARYEIDYVIFGSVERRYYGTDARIKFDDHFPVVCEATAASGETTRIYRVGNDG